MHEDDTLSRLVRVLCLRTLALGFGAPPEDAISGMIVTIISVGLGIPVLLVIVGSVCACVRKRRASNQSADVTSSYTAIQ